jgi:hypothetical protein
MLLTLVDWTDGELIITTSTFTMRLDVSQVGRKHRYGWMRKVLVTCGSKRAKEDDQPFLQ